MKNSVTLAGSDLNSSVERQHKDFSIADLPRPIRVDNCFDESLNLACRNNPRRHAFRQITKTRSRCGATPCKEVQAALTSPANDAMLRECLDAELLDSRFRLDPAFRTNDGDHFLQRVECAVFGGKSLKECNALDLETPNMRHSWWK